MNPGPHAKPTISVIDLEDDSKNYIFSHYLWIRIPEDQKHVHPDSAPQPWP
jgi:hypothetical protein